MFMKLFGYISGANVGENEIKMTVPVSMKMRGNKNSFEKEMCFYLDNEHQSNPPQPTNRDVYIVNRPAMNVYTRFVNVHLSYLNHYFKLHKIIFNKRNDLFSRRQGGYMNNDEWFEEAKALDDMIATKGLQVNNEHFYANGYNSPMQFWNRRNEVWKVKL